ncbi:Alkaline phosphatase D [Streptomyces sp. enrichment culture]
MDAWDGYPWARERLLRTVRESGMRSLVVFTGDVHVHHGFDIKGDFDDPASRTPGVELVTTPISSGGNGARRPANREAVMTGSPHLRFSDGRRGDVLVSWTSGRCGPMTGWSRGSRFRAAR